MNEKQPEQLDWLNTAQQARDRLRSIAYTLETLVESLYIVTGKTLVTQTLDDVSQELRELGDKVCLAASQKLDKDYKQAQEHSGLLLKAALAGAFTKPKE
jgi:hypothetical protein